MIETEHKKGRRKGLLNAKKENPVAVCWKVTTALGVSVGLVALLVGFFSLNTGYTGLMPPLTVAVFSFLSLVVIPLYLLPGWFAYRAGIPDARRALILNIFLGWTVAGYIGILIFIKREQKKMK